MAAEGGGGLGVFVLGSDGQLTRLGGPAAPLPDDPVTQLEKLADLHNRGALTDAQFEGQKHKLLDV